MHAKRASKRTGPSAPKHLSRPSAELFARLVGDYGLDDDAAGIAILVSGLESLDRAEEARAILAAEGIVSTDRYGGRKVHPAAAVEKDARAAFLAAMRALKLDVEPPYAGPGRPPGSTRGR